MAVADERLVLEASVVDDFTDTLGDLSEQLLAVDEIASQTVEDIHADVEIDEALRDLATLGGAMDAVDDDITIGTDVDDGLGGDVVAGNDIFDLDGVDLTDREAVGVFSFFTGHPGDTWSPSESLTPDGPTADATADGGGSDTAILDSNDIERFREEFGEAFDPSAVFSDRPPQAPVELLDGGIGDFVDQNEALGKILDGDLDVDVFERLGGLDTDEAMDALGELQDAGVTNLPTGLTDRFRNLELKMGDFFRIFAALIPLLAVFIGALPAAISGVVALGGAALAAAGALAGLGGVALLSGVLTSSGEVDATQLTERIDALLDDAAAELGPEVQQFAPLLDESFDTVEDTIEDVADRVDVFNRVVGDAEGALQYLEETVPVAMADIVRFGDAAMPIIAGVIREAGNMGILRAFADLIVRLTPLLATMTKFFIGALPAVIQLSEGFLKIATVIGGVIYLVGRLIDVVPYAGQVIGALTAGVLTFVSAASLFVLVTGSGVIPSVLGMAGSMLTSIPIVGALATALKGAALSAYTFLGSIFSTAAALLGKYTVGVLAAIAGSYGLSTALITATVAATALVGVLTLGLGPALGFLSGGFTDLSSDIDKATSSLESFASASGSLDGTQVGVNGQMSGATGSGARRGYQDGSQITVVAGDKEMGNTVANQLAFSSIGGQLGESNVADRRHDGGT